MLSVGANPRWVGVVNEEAAGRGSVQPRLAGLPIIFSELLEGRGPASERGQCHRAREVFGSWSK